MAQNTTIETHDGLAPMDDPTIIKKEIETTNQNSIMICGHLPHLSRFAADLLTGNKDRDVIRFKNAVIVCLSKGHSTWQLEWMVTPEII